MAAGRGRRNGGGAGRGRIQDVRWVREFFETGSGRSRGLHVVGEAGVGKTTLLDAVADAEAEAGVRVLRADGVEFEADIPFAGLHQILTPVLDDAERLPAAYRDALLVALGFATGPAPDRLMLVNATLALLRQAAAGASLMLIVDDLPWLDRASAVVLGFVSRRLHGSQVAFLAASRTDLASVFDHGGLEEYALGPLDDDSAHLLLSARDPGMAARVRARVVAESLLNRRLGWRCSYERPPREAGVRRVSVTRRARTPPSGVRTLMRCRAGR
ncbi:AAA family ATPase [Streptomyces niveus]|uniref:AAA family ATPase n=1 Tax=Streptomyces niveus TaxID=193462 RepID=UPI003679AE84